MKLIRFRLVARIVPITTRISLICHRIEHPFHLAYFSALSTGFLDYHLIAAGCAVIGFLALIPQVVPGEGA